MPSLGLVKLINDVTHNIDRIPIFMNVVKYAFLHGNKVSNNTSYVIYQVPHNARNIALNSIILDTVHIA